MNVELKENLEEVRLKKNETQQENRKSKNSILKIVCIEILVFIFICASFGIKWAFESFDNCSIESILFQLSEPLDGTNPEVVKEGIINIFGYGILELLGLNLIYFIIAKILNKVLDKHKKILKTIKILLVVLFIICNVVYILKKSEFSKFIKNEFNSNIFFEENYVDSKNVSLEFPEKKRNLIYIILESMEISYADKENNGCMETNLIPELTEIMKENINFSNNETGIGGAYSYTGTGWTVGALVSEMAGIPLKLSIAGNDYGKFAHFLPGATALGDILEENGYNQMFICGSPISFGGRDKFFAQHGNYEILDYDKAVETGRYKGELQNWGFIDKYLYEYTKEELLILSQEDKPFNMTILTADTHHPNGFLCEECEKNLI